MTNIDKMAGAVDPRLLIEELSKELQILEMNDDDDAEFDVESWADEKLKDVPLRTLSVVAAAIDDLIPRNTPSQSGMAVMISAADRVLSQRSQLNGLLPVLLRTERERLGVTLDSVANQSKISIQELANLESGATVITRIFPVPQMARWISSVPADRTLSLEALRRSLRVGWMDEEAVAAGNSSSPASVEDYVTEVIEELAAIEVGR